MQLMQEREREMSKYCFKKSQKRTDLGVLLKSIIITPSATARCKVNPLMTIVFVHSEMPTIQPLHQSLQMAQEESPPPQKKKKKKFAANWTHSKEERKKHLQPFSNSNLRQKKMFAIL